MDRVLRELRERGLLLQQDKSIASVVGLITGESLSKSWWSHPQSHAIFQCLEKLADDADVLTSRLIAGKVTFVHRRLWPAFLSVALSNAPWQKPKSQEPRELQQRLLVAAKEVHTASGRHELQLQSWNDWAREHDAHERIAIDEAIAQLEEAAVAIGARASMLPWRRLTSS
jgi:hypothetical protein